MSRFYIPASVAVTERRPRILKHGDTFGVFDHYDDILAAADTSDGLYHRDTRRVRPGACRAISDTSAGRLRFQYMGVCRAGGSYPFGYVPEDDKR